MRGEPQAEVRRSISQPFQLETDMEPSRITIIGLGPGNPEWITRKAWQALEEGEEIYLRSRRHPSVPHFPPHLIVHAFDDLYERLDSYEAVYQTIVERLLELAARPEGVVYAVPGDPSFGEATVLALRREAGRAGLNVKLIHGVSFVEPCLAALGVDALDGLVVADALTLAAGHHPPFGPDAAVLIGQLYSSDVAADVKLTLMNQYPDEHPIRLIHAVGTLEERVEPLRLYQVDRSQGIGELTTLFVPPMSQPSSFEAFQETVAHLRAPDGCPWDREQTHQSLRPHLLEEAYEALGAIDADDIAALKEELGDLMLQIVIQTQIATEEGEFSMADVIASINAKLIKRHPHVFGDVEVTDVEQVLRNWETLKAAERGEKDSGKGLLDGVPIALPALSQAAELQRRARRVGFDWPSIEGVSRKIKEELEEVADAPDPEAKADEIGDLLFAIVNFARWHKVDPEAALRRACRRFRRRFSKLEAKAQGMGKDMADLSLEEMDHLWEEVKAGEG